MSTLDEFYTMLKGVESIKPTAPSEHSAVENDILASEPEAKTPVTLRTVFTHHDTHPVVILIALTKAFNSDWIEWDVSTIYSEIKRVFSSDVSEHARAKIQCIKTLSVSPLPWTDWQVFEKIVQGLNNNIPSWSTMQAPALEQLYTGVDIMDSISKKEFSNEVKLYMAAAVLNEEVTFVPPPLDFIQLEVSQPIYKCGDCGLEESALSHDGVCTSCSKKMSHEKGLSMSPDVDASSSGKGKNLELVVKLPFESVSKRWDEVKSLHSDSVEFNETMEDVQVAKLIIARDYMNFRRRQLIDQLTALKSWLGA